MTTVDVSFGVRGTWVPRDHGYLLYGAICGVLPALHEASWLGIQTLVGVRAEEERVYLDAHSSLRLRLPMERIPEVMALAGRAIELANRPLQIGVPTIYPLVAAPVLEARLVLLKLTGTNAALLASPEGAPDPLQERYRAEIARQLAKLGIDRPFELVRRARLTISSRTLVGFAMRISGLSENESLRLMTEGVGGRRRMGAGIFRPGRAEA